MTRDIDTTRADGRIRTDLPEGAVMENGMKNQTTSAGRPYGRSTIYGKDHNTPYMTRYWFGRLRLHIFYRGDHDPDPHDHPWSFWTFPLTPYVEEVTLPLPLHVDKQYDTIYSEQRYVKHWQIVRAFWPQYRPATHTHRVIGRFNGHEDGLTPRTVHPNVHMTNDAVDYSRRIITIVWRGPDERKWGFLKKRDGRWCWVHWKEYVFGEGKSAPCE